jgi:hypothetical protein
MTVRIHLQDFIGRMYTVEVQADAKVIDIKRAYAVASYDDDARPDEGHQAAAAHSHAHARIAQIVSGELDNRLEFRISFCGSLLNDQDAICDRAIGPDATVDVVGPKKFEMTRTVAGDLDFGELIVTPRLFMNFYEFEGWRARNPAPIVANAFCIFGIQNVDLHFAAFRGVKAINLSNPTEGGICEGHYASSCFDELSGVKYLVMKLLRRVTNRAFDKLAGVEYLDISGCSLLTDAICKNIVGVETLVMRWSRNQNDFTFEGVKVLLPFLKKVDLRDAAEYVRNSAVRIELVRGLREAGVEVLE